MWTSSAQVPEPCATVYCFFLVPIKCFATIQTHLAYHKHAHLRDDSGYNEVLFQRCHYRDSLLSVCFTFCEYNHASCTFQPAQNLGMVCIFSQAQDSGWRGVGHTGKAMLNFAWRRNITPLSLKSIGIGMIFDMQSKMLAFFVQSRFFLEPLALIIATLLPRPRVSIHVIMHTCLVLLTTDNSRLF